MRYNKPSKNHGSSSLQFINNINWRWYFRIIQLAFNHIVPTLHSKIHCKHQITTWISSMNTRWVVPYLARRSKALWLAKSSNCVIEKKTCNRFQLSNFRPFAKWFRYKCTCKVYTKRLSFTLKLGTRNDLWGALSLLQISYAFLLAFSQSLICHLVQHAFNLSNIYSDYIWSNKTSQSTITTQFPSLLDDWMIQIKE